MLVCADPRRMLARAARLFYDAPDSEMALVGVTGTNGKTTCVQLIASILAHWRGQAASMGTLGLIRYGETAPLSTTRSGGAAASGLTTAEAPQLVAQLRQLVGEGCAAAALEASSIALDQGRLDGVLLDVAAWSNFSQDHLDYHGDLTNYFQAKRRLFEERLKPDGTAVFNADDAAQEPLVAPRMLAFSAHGPTGRSGRAADVYCLRVQPDLLGTHLTVHTPMGVLRVGSALVGDFNVENVLLAISCACALGVPSSAICAGIEAVAGVPGRLQRVVADTPNLQAPQVLVDYAHTPDALERLLAAVRPLTPGKLWCVFGCGGERDPDKRPMMGAAVARGCDVGVLTSDNPRGESPEAIAAAVARGLVQAGGHEVADAPAAAAAAGAGAQDGTGRPGGSPFFVQLDRAAAIRAAVASAAATDTVVVAGKGHETVQVVGPHQHPFDDREHARRALNHWPEI